MGISLSNESKTNLDLSLESKDNDITWDEANYTWEEADRQWDSPGRILSKESK